ncbi:MAG TPA: MBL fold metallo-hydrolase [Methylomirabilota bacterium]|nr:MBL fold metallo-hydrolase [Methylomirabilota bacterium]
MKVRLFGTRGSLAAPGAETARYGGNTSAAQVIGPEGTVLALDAGTGIRALGMGLPKTTKRVDVLLTHLHMDHIQGLGFFAPLYNPGMEVHIWGPATRDFDLRARLTKYLSPPLFPVHFRDLPCKLFLHHAPATAEVGELKITATLVCHPGLTVGYRIESRNHVVTYLPDHEPMLGAAEFPKDRSWTSGYDLAEGADLLVHDCQYTPDEYAARVGWGHSSFPDAIEFAARTGAKHFVPFHHDPSHDDARLDELFLEALTRAPRNLLITPAQEGAVFDLGSQRERF